MTLFIHIQGQISIQHLCNSFKILYRRVQNSHILFPSHLTKLFLFWNIFIYIPGMIYSFTFKVKIFIQNYISLFNILCALLFTHFLIPGSCLIYHLERGLSSAPKLNNVADEERSNEQVNEQMAPLQWEEVFSAADYLLE